MRKFKGSINIGLSGCQRNFEFELPDDATEEDIEEATKEAAMDHIDYWAEEITEDQE